MKEISNQVEQVLQYALKAKPGGLGIDEYMINWIKNKSGLIGKDRLIYESPEEITFDISDTSRISMVKDFCEKIDEYYGYSDLADFVFDNRKTFYDNIVSMEYYDGDIEIKKGSKIIKSFKYFITEKEDLTTLQNEASMMIQQTKVTGKLCISIHPLDFLSSSENNYNWRSCHSLDGDFAVGNLSYLQDGCTAICYLKGADNVKLPNFPATVPWNDKKWRMLVHISKNKDFIFAGRQYPFFSEDALNKVKTLLLDKVFPDQKFEEKWSDMVITDLQKDDIDYPLDDTYYYVNGGLYPLTSLAQPAEDYQHYNDLFYSTVYKHPHILPNKSTRKKKELDKIIIGHDVVCNICGTNRVINRNLICSDCLERRLYK